MPITKHALIYPGLAVSIILKADQRSGKQVQGVVADILTRRDHPRGIKVRLRDGRIGRVHALPTSSTTQIPRITRKPPPGFSSTMSSQNNNNPWANEESQGNGGNNPWGQQQQQQPQGQGQNANYYQAPSNPPPGHQQQQQQTFQHPNRSQTDSLLPQGQERSEQVETMQNYESRATLSKEDKDREQLQKEFPGIDGSLIAALYGDNKDVAETRELLQELASTT